MTLWLLGQCRVPHVLVCRVGIPPKNPGPWFDIETSSCQYRKSHCGDKTVVRSSYLHDGISYIAKMVWFYWIRAQNAIPALLCFVVNWHLTTIFHYYFSGEPVKRNRCHVVGKVSQINTNTIACPGVCSKWNKKKGSKLRVTSPLWWESLVTSKCMMVSSNGNFFRFTGPLCGEFTGHRWIPLTKASEVELWCFLWSVPE